MNISLKQNSWCCGLVIFCIQLYMIALSSYSIGNLVSFGSVAYEIVQLCLHERRHDSVAMTTEPPVSVHVPVKQGPLLDAALLNIF